MSKFTLSKPLSVAQQKFVAQAATALPESTLDYPSQVESRVDVKPARVVMRQLNIDLPETLYDRLQTLVKGRPQMSMRKMVIKLIEDELERHSASLENT